MISKLVDIEQDFQFVPQFVLATGDSSKNLLIISLCSLTYASKCLGGKTPFAALTNAEVAEQVAGGLKLSCPTSCPSEVYQLMLTTWAMEPEERPAFHELFVTFYRIIDFIASRCLANGMYDA